MTLRTRLIISFCFVGCATIGMAAMATLATRQMNMAIIRTGFAHDQYKQFSQLAIATSAFLKEIADGLLNNENAELDKQQLESSQQQISACMRHLDESLQREFDFVAAEERDEERIERQRLTELRALMDKLRDLHEQILTAAERGDMDQVRSLFETQVEYLYDVQIHRALAVAIASEGQEVDETHTSAMTLASHLRATATYGSLAVVLLCVLVGGNTIRMITRPVNQLVEGAHRFGAGELDYRIPEEGHTELTQLTRQFNTMAVELLTQRERLEAAHRQLLGAWEAGVAEVAGGVLHNIGNVVNSINVSISTLNDFVREQSEWRELDAIIEQIGPQRDDWVRFLTSDERGEALPGYLGAIAEHAADEHERMNREIDSLVTHVGHVRKILDIQKNYAHSSEVEAGVDVSSLLEDAIQICGNLDGVFGIELVREYADVPRIAVDKHKVLQILINLLRNAKQSIREQTPDTPRIIVQTARAENGVRISVADNGVGIAPTDLERVFSYGFTTKRHGQGIGLHNARLAAKVMEGELTVRSDGVGCGAAFDLRLPLAPIGASV